MAGKPKTKTDADTTTSVDGVDAIIDTSNIVDGVISGDVITGDEIGTVVPAVKSAPERRAVVFLGPYHRYSRADVAAFDAEYAEELVTRKIAAWPEDAKRALNPRRGDDDHETDIG
ncbi:hypothetical protein ACTNF7_003457 [Citrobacter braakii]